MGHGIAPQDFGLIRPAEGIGIFDEGREPEKRLAFSEKDDLLSRENPVLSETTFPSFAPSLSRNNLIGGVLDRLNCRGFNRKLVGHAHLAQDGYLPTNIVDVIRDVGRYVGIRCFVKSGGGSERIKIPFFEQEKDLRSFRSFQRFVSSIGSGFSGIGGLSGNSEGCTHIQCLLSRGGLAILYKPLGVSPQLAGEYHQAEGKNREQSGKDGYRDSRSGDEPIVMRLIFFIFFLVVGFGVGMFGWQRFYDQGGLLSAAQIGIACLFVVIAIALWIFG